MGSRVGDEVSGKVAGKEVTYEVLKIEPYMST
jgi:transcription elongation GreA/GreB family factor